MKFNFALLSAITLLSAATFLLIVACNKQGAQSNPNSAATGTIASARQYFESTVLPVPAPANAEAQNPQAALPKTPMWGQAYVTKTGLGDMVVVPVNFKNSYFLKRVNGNQSYSAGLFTSLVVYKDSTGQYRAELVTKVPDDSYVMDQSAQKKFTGIVRVEDWQGNFIKGYHYSNGVTDKYYVSSKVAHQNSKSGTTAETVQFCEIYDNYNCADAGGGDWECDYAYSTETCQDDGVIPTYPYGSGGAVYQNVYHYIGSGPTGSGGTWATTTNVGLVPCTAISFTTVNGNLVANFNGLAYTWSNSVQGTVSISYPNSCISMTATDPVAASSIFNQSITYAKQQVTNGLNSGTILPADVSSKFINALGYALEVGYFQSTWDPYSNCSVTAPVNTAQFCQPIAP